MHAFFDALVAIVGRDAAPFVGMVLLSSPLWLLGVVRLWQALQRRRAFQDFAAAKQLRFVGTTPSDARAPYTRIDRVSRAVLLYNVVEGQSDGLPIHLFDMPVRRGAQVTTVIVTVEGRLRHGAEAERAIAAIAEGPAALIETDVDVLAVSPRRRLDPSEWATWLSFATALAKAMERDATADVPFDASAGPPPSRREMFDLSAE
jgi:hypothetical protein